MKEEITSINFVKYTKDIEGDCVECGHLIKMHNQPMFLYTSCEDCDSIMYGYGGFSSLVDWSTGGWKAINVECQIKIDRMCRKIEFETFDDLVNEARKSRKLSKLNKQSGKVKQNG